MKRQSKSVVMLRTTELLDVFGLIISEGTSEVRLVVKDDFCTIQTYSDKELLQESSKLELLGSNGAKGVYSYPLKVFEKILDVITKDLEEHNCDITALVFDTENKKTSILITEGRYIIDYLNKLDIEDLVMEVKAEELYKALKDIEDFYEFEMSYLNYENGVFNIELYIDEDTDEWYESDNKYPVIDANFDKLWKPLVASDMIDYLIAFVKAGVDNKDTIKIIFTTEDYLKFQIAKSIELSFNYRR